MCLCRQSPLNVSLLDDPHSVLSNIALMKISAYHKERGDVVKMCDPLFDQPDILYISKLFEYTKDIEFNTHEYTEIVKGGIGFNFPNQLPTEIDCCFPDYNLYPNNNYSIGYTTRGCIRKCHFCKIPEYEGEFRITGDLYSFWGRHKNVIFLDNNILANEQHFEMIANQVIKERVVIDFNQGLDFRLINTNNAMLIRKMKFKNGWVRFSWDNPDDESKIIKGIQILKDANVSLTKLSVYVLVGFNTTFDEDMYRILTLKKLGISPFVMLYHHANKQLNHLARWCNRHEIFKSCTFDEYSKGDWIK